MLDAALVPEAPPNSDDDLSALAEGLLTAPMQEEPPAKAQRESSAEPAPDLELLQQISLLAEADIPDTKAQSSSQLVLPALLQEEARSVTAALQAEAPEIPEPSVQPARQIEAPAALAEIQNLPAAPDAALSDANGAAETLTPSEEALVEVDLPGKLTLGGRQGSSLDVRLTALAADMATVVVPALDVLPSNVSHRLAFSLPGTPRPLVVETRIQSQRGLLDETGNGRQLLHLGFTWVGAAEREAVAAYCWNRLDTDPDELIEVSANVKLEVIEGARQEAQFLGKSLYATRAAVQCLVDNFDLEPGARVRLSFIAPRFADQLVLEDGVVGVLAPSGPHKSEVQVAFVRPHDELIHFIAAHFANKPSPSFLSRFLR